MGGAGGGQPWLKFLGIMCFVLGFVFAVFLWRSHESGGNNHEHANAAPAFDILGAELSGANGESINLRALAGENKKKTIVVNFWATWCAPCVHEMPLFDEAAKKSGMLIVGITTDKRAEIEKFLRRAPVEYPLFTAKFDIFYFFQQNGNKTGVLPFTVLLDSNGGIIRKKLGEFPDAESIIQFASAN